MNWIPPPQESESAIELPPPVLPKSLITSPKVLQSSDHEKNLPKTEMAINSLPVLPPKRIKKLVFNE